MVRFTFYDNNKARLVLNGTEFTGAAVDRFSAYEDTGLTPEQVKMQAAYIEENTVLKTEQINGVDFRRIDVLTKADREHRLMVLPYALGQRVYVVFDGAVAEGAVHSYELDGAIGCTVIVSVHVSDDRRRIIKRFFARDVYTDRKTALASIQNTTADSRARQEQERVTRLIKTHEQPLLKNKTAPRRMRK